MEFKVCENVSSLGIKVIFLVIYSIDNTLYDDNLKNIISKFYDNFYKTYTQEDLEQDKNILGYRLLHQKVSFKDKSLIASPESLIHLIFKYKSLKPINFIVDTYNYVAIKNKVSIGAHDLQSICGNVRLCFTEGNEKFTPLGSQTSKIISKNEYCYIDDSNEVICRLDCRQSEKTKTSPKTQDCLFIIQGHSEIPEQKLISTAEELRSLILIQTEKKNNSIIKLL